MSEKAPEKVKVVKVRLKSVMHEKYLLQTNNLVLEFNQLIIDSWQFIRLFLLHKYHTLEDPHSFFESTIDRTFFRKCVRTLCSLSVEKENYKNDALVKELNQFYEEEFKELVNHKKLNLAKKSRIIDYLSQDMCTNFMVNIKEHYYDRLINYAKTQCRETNVTKQEISKFVFEFMTRKPNSNESLKDLRSEYELYFVILGSEKNIFFDIQDKPQRYIHFSINLIILLENSGAKLFQFCPLRTDIVPKHITLDTKIVGCLFLGLSAAKIKTDEEVWKKILNFNHRALRDSKNKCMHMIKTDGISCSLLFRNQDKKTGKKDKPKKRVEETKEKLTELTLDKLNNLSTKNIVGCDPGKNNLVFMVDSRGNKLRYTQRQREEESRQRRNKQVLEKEKLNYEINEKEIPLSKLSCKTVKYDQFKEYIKEKSKLNQETLDFYQKDLWRKMKFRSYCYGRKSLDNFLNKIERTFGKDCVVAYGNWSRDTQMKYCAPTMNKGLKESIQKRFETYIVDEYKTSKLCCKCHKELNKFENRYFLLECNNCQSFTNERSRIHSRDVNAAKNIRDKASLWITKQKVAEHFLRNNDLHHTNNMEKV
jgi:hypothetical protein